MPTTNSTLIENDPETLRRVARQLVYQKNSEQFFKDQLRIEVKDIGLAPLTLNAAQAPIMKLIKDQLKKIGKIRLLIGKCRQPGISTFCAALVAHKYFLTDNVYAFTVAQDKTTASRIFRMHELFYTGMDTDLRPAQKYHTKGTEMVLGDTMTESRLLVGEAKNMNVGTGQTIHVLHASECGRYMYPDQINDSLIPACSNSPGTIQIFETTAHTAPGGAWFKSRCERAMAGEGEFIFHFNQWWLMPEYQTPLKRGEKLKLSDEEKNMIRQFKMLPENIKWRRLQLDSMNGDIEMFRQNYPCTFEESWVVRGAGAFPNDRLLELRQMCRPPIKRYSIVDGKFYQDDEGEFLVWFESEPGKTYDVGADVGSGNADQDGDPSTIEVIERYSLKQVAEWRGFIEPMDFADVLAAVGTRYGNAQVAPEVEGAWGGGTLARLRQVYTNIYLWRRNRDRIAPDITGDLGWFTSYQSKQVLVAFCRHNIWHRKLQIFSVHLWSEMRNFKRDVTPSGLQTFNAASGEHDDLLMAYMIALQTSDDENLMKWEGSKIDAAIGRKIETLEGIDQNVYRSKPLTAISPRELSDETGDWN